MVVPRCHRLVSIRDRHAARSIASEVMADISDRFTASFGALAAIGRGTPTGGYRRLTWSAADDAARAWFHDEAERLGLAVEVDRNGNLWAWWGEDRVGTVACGSHLDTVVDGGAFDGALGIVAAFSAVEELMRSERRRSRPVAVVAFIEEEGARFGVPTLGSRLLSGAIDPDRVRDLVDADGISFASAMRSAGLDPDGIGPDPDRLAAMGCFIELHIEQGLGLAEAGLPVGTISGIWPHGRWRLTASGGADHAGTTRLENRRDPMVVAARAVTHARSLAEANDLRATVGRIQIEPNTTNTIAASVTVWLDVRGPGEEAVEEMVGEWTRRVEDDATGHGVAVAVTCESRSRGVEFDTELRTKLRAAIEAAGIEPSETPTAAGHDAAILAEHLPAAMLHVRNPTGISHSPHEHADAADCVDGVAVLTHLLGMLACR